MVYKSAQRDEDAVISHEDKALADRMDWLIRHGRFRLAHAIGRRYIAGKHTDDVAMRIWLTLGFTSAVIKRGTGDPRYYWRLATLSVGYDPAIAGDILLRQVAILTQRRWFNTAMLFVEHARQLYRGCATEYRTANLMAAEARLTFARGDAATACELHREIHLLLRDVLHTGAQFSDNLFRWYRASVIVGHPEHGAYVTSMQLQPGYGRAIRLRLIRRWGARAARFDQVFDRPPQ